MMAAAGDDLQNDAREEIQDANTEVLPDPDNESSDDDDNKEVGMMRFAPSRCLRDD